MSEGPWSWRRSGRVRVLERGSQWLGAIMKRPWLHTAFSNRNGSVSDTAAAAIPNGSSISNHVGNGELSISSLPQLGLQVCFPSSSILPFFLLLFYCIDISMLCFSGKRLIMGERYLAFLLLIFSYFFIAVADKASQDYNVMLTLKFEWENTSPPIWVGTDPCGDDGWVGIKCFNSRVTSITLASMNLSGKLPSDIGLLSELQILFLINCGFTGPIPNTIGNLKRLVFLSLNKNSFSGRIPPDIGKLSNLNWLDLAENKLEGPIPISNGTTPGLDMLHRTEHLLFEGNRLTGVIPSTLVLVQSLEVVRFDGNILSGPLPVNLNNLTKVQELFLSKNRLSGPLPNLTGMNVLSYLMMDKTQLQGQIPVSLFSQLELLQTVVLRDNRLNGTLDIGTAMSNELVLLDLQKNLIEEFAPKIDVSKVEIILAKNPVCQDTGVVRTYCSIAKSNDSYKTPPNNCVPATCSSDQILSPHCKCAYPYTGTLTFRGPSFSGLGNDTVFVNLELSLMQSFQLYETPVDSVSLSNPRKDVDRIQYLELTLQVFPSGQDRFNRSGISGIAFLLSNQTYKPPAMFGPYYYIADTYEHYLDDLGPVASSKSSNIGIIAGAAAGGSVLLVLLLLASVYAFRQKKKAKRATSKRNPFEQWDPDESNSSTPQLKGARRFTFEEMQNYTKNFSQVNNIGSGGYGKVYRGTLPNGELIAVKRAQKESIQGGLEFKTEIELLSRVHHKNLVSLLGFCFEQGEQMLVYEYVANGTLKDALSGKYIVKLVKSAIDKTKDIYGLKEILDPTIDLGTTLNGFDKFVDLALQCVAESSSNRPSMNYVVKEIENMLHLAGSNPNAESASSSSSYNVSKGTLHPYDNEYFGSSVLLPRA
ncbi:Serine-threonine/tyrosine-protein kinase, catalytic domain [Sesbania bispinosa]|nr:Serine-threonine/tyrosine-protein kinase, catalytic domain [Sesbania bispinosa]